MPHLNKIQSQYSARGLIVVAVSNENAGTVEPWLQRNGVRYGNALSKSASGAYGVRGIPDAFLIGPDGVIRWRGHPQMLSSQEIEIMLGGGSLPTSAGPAGISRNLLMVLALSMLIVLFIAAVGCYWHSTRERIPAHLKPGYLPPPEYGAPSHEQPYMPQQQRSQNDNRPPWEG